MLQVRKFAYLASLGLLTSVTIFASSLAQAQGRPASQTTILKAIQDRGRLNCGVVAGLYGFSFADSRGELRGFDVDTCRALAAAVLSDANRVNLRQLNFQNRFDELRADQVDVVAGQNTWNIGRDLTGGLAFPMVNLFGNQGFLVHSELRVQRAVELNGARICMGQGSTTERLVADWARANRIRIDVLVMESSDQLIQAFFAKSCDAIVGTAHLLAGLRASRGSYAEKFSLLPDELSLEPNGPAVRAAQEQNWFNVVRWVLNSLIAAEELGITQANAAGLAQNSPDPRVRRLLQGQSNIDAALGLSSGWALRAIQAVGNYGEIWERHLGQNSALKLPRGRNELGSRGGMLYSPVFAD
jgi:general L-amino acid transport system substrate-binding protein